MAEIKFVKIVVKIGDAELSLSLDEVRALRDELNKVISEPMPVNVPIVYPWPTCPRTPCYEEPYKITWYKYTTGDNSNA